MSGLVELDILYVGDHYVDQYIDTIVQLADAEEGYYGFEGYTVLGCDSSWYVVFNEIREAITLYDSLQIYNGDVRTWHNIEITEPGIKFDTIRSELGGVMAYCQLTVSLLDVELYSDSIELAEGETYIWRDSIEITEPGIYRDSVYSEFGGLMAIYELTVTAAAPVGQGKTFELVTTQLTDWSGNYLIVFADNMAHATVSGKDLAATSDVLTISEDNKIVTADSCFVTVAAMGTDYSVQLPNGNYLGAQKNGVTSNANAVALTFNYTADGVQIAGTASGTEYILYCNTNNGTFYRMYVDKTGTSGYTLPQLYKEVTGEGPATKVETINAEDGAVKVILNGNLYIIRDNQWYDATGRLTVDPRK
jgi:fibronectin type 3 domain-containing protein